MAKKVESVEYYINLYRRQSPVIGERRGVFTEKNYPVIPGDVHNLKNNLLMLTGSEEEEGMYYSPNSNTWKRAAIHEAKDRVKVLNEDFKDYKQSRVNAGHKLPTEMPAELLESFNQWTARLAIYEEEVKWLTKELAKAEQEESERIKELEPCFPANRKFWNNFKQNRDGILVEVAGQKTDVNADGLMVIADERSPMNGLEVWRFREHVVLIFEREQMYRNAEELKQAMKEGRPRRKTPVPAVPIYNPSRDEITYPDYNKELVKKLLNGSAK